MATVKKATIINDPVLARHENIKKIREQELVTVDVSPLYAPYFGKRMPVVVNGVAIWFPVDGSTRRVHKCFADEISRRKDAIDAHIKRVTHISNVKNNVEHYPGEINMF